MNDAIRMQLSAYVDGELPGNEAEMLLRRVCQDPELRQEIGEYLALRRLLRGESGLAAADRLHERVAAEIDHRPIAAISSAANVVRAVRPLAGIAIAASVALLAIFALQQIDTGSDADPESTRDPVAIANRISSPVPDIGQPTEQHRQLFLNHANASSRFGANDMIFESVELRFSEELPDETDFDEVRDDNNNPQTDAENPSADDPDLDRVMQP